MSPRSVLLGSVPIFSKRGFGEKRSLSRVRARLLFENGNKGTARRRQVNLLEQSDTAIFADHCFVRLNHVRNLRVFSSGSKRTEKIKQFSQTIKTQPWRLIWPTTVKYPEASPTPAVAREGTITARRKPRPLTTSSR
jgi:hypothetical protein